MRFTESSPFSVVLIFSIIQTFLKPAVTKRYYFILFLPTKLAGYQQKTIRMVVSCLFISRLYLQAKSTHPSINAFSKFLLNYSTIKSTVQDLTIYQRRLYTMNYQLKPGASGSSFPVSILSVSTVSNPKQAA